MATDSLTNLTWTTNSDEMLLGLTRREASSLHGAALRDAVGSTTDY